MAVCRLPYPLAHKSLMAKSEAMRDQQSMRIELNYSELLAAGTTSALVGALPSKAGSACVFSSETLKRSPLSTLSIRRRRQGAAPLGGGFTCAGGSKYFRSNNSPMARRRVTPPMPLKVPMMTGKSGNSLFC